MRLRAGLLACGVAAVAAASLAGCGNSSGNSPADAVLTQATKGQDAQAKANLSTALVGV